MSGQATGWVLANGPRPEMCDRNGRPYGKRAPSMRAVLLSIADGADIYGTRSRKARATIAGEALISVRQAVTVIDELTAEGWIQIDHPGGGRNRAALVSIPRMRTPVDIDGNGAAQTAPFQPVENELTGEKGCSLGPETVQSRLHPNGGTVEIYPPTPQHGSPVDSRPPAAEQLTLFVDSVLATAADQIRVAPGPRRHNWCRRRRPYATQLAANHPRAPVAVLVDALLGRPVPDLARYRAN